MQFIIKVLFLFIGVHLAIYAEDSLNSVPQGYHVFNSNVYTVYSGQLKEFAEQEIAKYPQLNTTPNKGAYSLFQNECLQLVNWIQKGPSTDLPSDKQAFHKTLITQLRYVIGLKPLQLDEEGALTQSLIAFVDDLCVWMYTTPHVLKAMQDFLEQQFPLAFPSSINAESWVSLLQNLYKSIDTDTRFDGLTKVNGALYNPHLYGDVPSYLFSIFSENKEIKLIRTHNTTFSSYASDSSEDVNMAIIPEFTNYLSAIAKQGKKHLYVNYIARQNIKSSHETALLEQLEKDPEFGSSIFVVSLARNSLFYKQEDHFSDLDDAQTFKNAFMDELFADSMTSNYYWSNKLELSSWKDNIEALLNEVHSIYFSDQTTLSLDERKEFIDLAYVKITQDLMTLLQPDIVNLSCQISIDRGPTAFSLLYIDLLLQQKDTLDLADLQTIATLVYGPGALVRNRSIDATHGKRFLKAAERIQSVKSSSCIKGIEF